jgi:MYXO-CTERM domain-containing protein
LNENKCLVNTACNANGECTSDEEKNCDDNNPCTRDSCDPELGCVSEPDDEAECDDGNVCTQNDTCVDGVCTPESGVKCAPIDDCHEAGECDPTNGQCDDPRKPDGEECETTGVCMGGRCEGGTPEPGGEGGAPAVGEAGAPGTGEGGAGEPPSSGGGGEDSGGDSSGPGKGGSTGTGGRGVIAPGPDAGEDDGPPMGQEFKREPGGCSVGSSSGSGIAGFLALAGLALVGLRRRGNRR